jgi:hypothetical protein
MTALMLLWRDFEDYFIGYRTYALTERQEYEGAKMVK